jgi:hypothetical protein
MYLEFWTLYLSSVKFEWNLTALPYQLHTIFWFNLSHPNT